MKRPSASPIQAVPLAAIVALAAFIGLWVSLSKTDYAAIARAKGFLQVAASPLTRSSYHAGDDFAKMQKARQAAQG